MDSIGAEVGQKIKSAIKAKLMELGAYVDEELPDYIMVMVANKRSKAQMNEDLQLFLCSNTEIFTNWLHSILQKLQEVKIDGKKTLKENSDSKSLKRKIDSDDLKKEKRKKSESKIIKLDRKNRQDNEKHNSGGGSNLITTTTTTPIAPDKEKESIIIKQKETIPRHETILPPPKPKPKIVLMKSDDDDDDEDFINIKEDAEEAEALLNSELKEPIKEVEKTKVVEKIKVEPKESNESEKQSIKLNSKFQKTEIRESSKVKLQKSKMSERLGWNSQKNKKIEPPNKYENDDVKTRTKELRTTKLPHKEEEQPAKKKSLSSRIVVKNEEPEEEYNPSSPGIASIVRVKPRPSLPASLQPPKSLILRAMADAHKSSVAAMPAKDSSRNTDNLIQIKISDSDKNNTQEYENSKKITSSLNNDNLIVQVSPQESNADDFNKTVEVYLDSESHENIIITKTQKTINPDSTNSTEKTRFVVTLDGFMDPDYNMDDHKTEISEKENTNDKSPKKRPVSPIVFDQDKDTITNTLQNINPLDLMKPKLNDRCKFWPNCTKQDKCPYFHPIMPCGLFPNCSLADKCKFIHPYCKYDAFCTKRDCPFTHKTIKLTENVATTCKYFPTCSNPTCRFLHPKACFFGRFCSKTGCNYLHEEFPNVNKLKWVSPNPK